ncbi:polysaccharide biosynthesis protein [Variovorax sp. VNK109]|uniref:polysaccharide biosynthesis protein n=1 Tax=Variovorax sp. VNK109 TaxID=3400919 RepID=UPI003BFE64CA
MLLDAALAVVATWLAFSLRLDVLHWPEGDQWKAYALSFVLALPVFLRFGLYRAIFRYTGIAAMAATVKAVALYGALLFVILVTMRWPMVPRSLGVLQPLIFLLLVAMSRALARFWLLDLVAKSGSRSARPRLLIYGAGAAGVQTANAVGTGQFDLMGFIDDDESKIGRSINRVTVLSAAQVPEAVERLGITDILLAVPSATRQRRNEILAALRSLPVHIRTLPGLGDLASGRVTVQDFQELDIEDLLGRDAVAPDPELLSRHLTGRTVLVTGAGGSIGSELCRQILLQRPGCLLLLDHSEYNLYAIHQELGSQASDSGVQLLPLLVSVMHAARMDDVFAAFRPDTVYHAAAYKHVPLVEQNAGEGLSNNISGTLITAQAALRHGVGRFVLVSTDKAVRPTNIMGASKRVAELVLQALAAKSAASVQPANGASGTTFAMVRFGNVLGSSGSVVPLFRRQLAAGGPLTVTHSEVTRYFMTIPEAAQLVLQAGAMAEGGEVFVLDMGEPVRILDLAHRMVRLSGLTVRDAEHPDGDIEIAITGLRPGEKLYEELLIGDDPQPTTHPRIMKARESMLDWPQLDAALERLRAAIATNDVPAAKAVLQEIVSGYQPEAETVDHLALATRP